MIERLYGHIAKKLNSGVIVDVQGVGYRVDVPLSFLCNIDATPKKPIEIWVHTRVKEDAIQLYGFESYKDKELFDLLVSVNKVGPRIGLAILSTLSITSILQAVETDNPSHFQSVPGVGTNLAGKIVLELKNKIKRLSFYGEVDSPFATQASASASETHNQKVTEDIRSALENLGFKAKDINKALKSIPADSTDLDFSSTMRSVLNSLNQPAGRRTQKTPLGELF